MNGGRKECANFKKFVQSFYRCEVPADGVRGQTSFEVATEGTLPSDVTHEARALYENTGQNWHIMKHCTEN